MEPSYPFKPIGSLRALSATLGITEAELLALKERSDSCFYITNKLKKPDGSVRLTYDVKDELKVIHERISSALLKKVKYPDYLHGSLKGKDYLSNCKQHLGKKFIISEDATNFFPSISKKIVHEVWVGVFGFSNEVARCLAELVTFDGALVQGAKPSSYISNLVLWKREADLVSKFEKLRYGYTRYVDDITISSAYNLSKKEQHSIIAQVYGMLKTIGVSPNRSKHKTMPNGKNQSVHRVNVNTLSPTLPKAKRANIRAAVHSCEKLHATSPQSSEYKTLFSQTMGKVNNMARMHVVEGLKLRKRLNRVKPS